MIEPPFVPDGLSSQAASGVLRSLQERKFCDFELVCDGQRIPVHKAVVCSQSPVLAAACSGRYQKCIGNCFEIPDTDPQTVTLMVQYLYTGKHAYSLIDPGCLHDVSVPISETRNLDNPDYLRIKRSYLAFLSAHIKLLAVAETCMIERLVTQVVHEFRAVLSRPDYGYCFAAVLEVIPRVYALETASGSFLRKECVDAIVASFGPWLTARGSHRQALDKLLLAVPQFAKDVLEGFIVVKHNPGQKQDPAELMDQ